MSRYNTPLNTRGYTTAELVRINDFVVREDALARDAQSVKALEEALAQFENALIEGPITDQREAGDARAARKGWTVLRLNRSG